MNTITLLAATIFSFGVHADIVDDYQAILAKDKLSGETFVQQVKNGDFTGCTKGGTLSACFKQKLTSIPLRSSVAFVMALDAAVEAALFDMNRGYKGTSAVTMLLDNTLLVYEKTNPALFQVLILKPRNREESEVWKDIKKMESEATNKAARETAQLIDGKFKEFEQLIAKRAGRTPADATEQWQETMYKNIKPRMTILKMSFAL